MHRIPSAVYHRLTQIPRPVPDTPRSDRPASDDIGRLLDDADRGFRDDRFDDPALNESYGLRARESAPLETRALADEVFADGRPLAAPGTRLLAQIIDGLCGLPVVALLIFGIAGESPPVAILAVLGFLGLLAYQLVLLAREGQTIGKRVLKIRIVDVENGGNPGFGRSFGIRGFLNGVISAVPYLGTLYALADVLFIFREDRRCLHDHLAKTIVVSEA